MSIGTLGRVGTGFSFVDLFAGLGGFRLALELLGGRCVLSSEIDRCARETYAANFGEWPSGDIRAIRAEDVPDHDILCGGFPCQTFSIAGKKSGFKDDTRGTLFFEIERILRIKKPSAILLENVRHLLNHDEGRTFNVIRMTLEDCGYVVFHQIINAGHYGAPTSRKRIYIVGLRADLGITDFRFPDPTFKPVKLADMLLPDFETGSYIVRNHPIHIDLNAVARAEGRVALKTLSVGRIGHGVPAKQGYRVYSPNGHAVTFLHRGGGVGAQTGIYLINGRVRKLSVLEMARTMGFPPSFVIPASLTYEQGRRLFGNSVVPPVIHSIAERILETIRVA